MKRLALLVFVAVAALFSSVALASREVPTQTIHAVCPPSGTNCIIAAADSIEIFTDPERRQIRYRMAAGVKTHYLDRSFEPRIDVEYFEGDDILVVRVTIKIDLDVQFRDGFQ